MSFLNVFFFSVVHVTAPAVKCSVLRCPCAARCSSAGLSAAGAAMRLKGFGFQRGATLSLILACQRRHPLPAPLYHRLRTAKNIVFHQRPADLILSILLPSPAGGFIWGLTGG